MDNLQEAEEKAAIRRKMYVLFLELERIDNDDMENVATRLGLPLWKVKKWLEYLKDLKC